MSTRYSTSLLLSLYFPASCFAIDLKVNHAVIGGANDGEGWPNAYSNLSVAIFEAYPGDEIWVAKGTYKPGTSRADWFNLRPDVAIYGGFNGTEGERDERDPIANETILSGDIGVEGDPTDNCYRVLNGSSGNSDTILDGFTVRDGQADGDGFNPSFNDRGGGIYIGPSGAAVLRNIRFINNHSRLWGGAITTGADGTVVQDCSFAGNSTEGTGGAITVLGGTEIEITRCSFDNNTTPMGGGSGGAVHVHLSAVAAFTECKFQNNVAKNGGAVSCSGGMTISTSTFRGNGAYWGGAVYINTSENPLIYNSEFSGNYAEQFGGALTSENGSVLVTSCTFEGNAAGSGGGAAYTKNTNPAFANTIMWYNTAVGRTDLSHSSHLADFGSSPTYHHCLIQGLYPAGEGNLSGIGAWGDNYPGFLDPVDAALAPTISGNLVLATNSPVLNQGDNDVDLDGAGPGNTTVADLAGDLNGKPRIDGSIVDMGAHEGGLSRTFNNLFPGLDPNGDINANGLSDFVDYAYGINPTENPAFEYQLRFIAPYVLIYSERIGTEDVQRQLEQSGDLQQWNPMIKDNQYLEFRAATSPTRVDVRIIVIHPVALGRLFARMFVTRL